MENIKKIEACRTFEDFIHTIMEIRGIPLLYKPAIAQRKHLIKEVYFVNGDTAVAVDNKTARNVYGKRSVDVHRNWGDGMLRRGKELATTVIYFDENGVCWESPDALTVHCEYTGKEQNYRVVINGLSFKRREKLYPLTEDYFLVNDKKSVSNILEHVNTSAAEYVKDVKDVCLERILLCPALEVLCREGYAFAADILCNKNTHYVMPSGREPRLDVFNRLIRYDGKSIEEIFKTTKPVYELLKDEKDLSVWEAARKSVQKDSTADKDAVKRLLDSGFTSNEVKRFYEVLNKEYNGKKIFTIDSLTQYLEKLDSEEAIPRGDALSILRRYLSICARTGHEPMLNSGSLKKEYDIEKRRYEN